VSPNPFQPRIEFNDATIIELSDSIRQYGILQPLTVTQVETPTADGGTAVHYELIAGERRLRASKMAGLQKVPVIIRVGDSNKERLELAIIENLQREDLNAVDRAKAFLQLAQEFSLSHTEIGKRMGKSREYVSNTLRVLALPQYILDGLDWAQNQRGAHATFAYACRQAR
jgi:ParB family chromosome partitioning protein